MDKKIYIKGGSVLSGEVTVDGSKNSALACLVAACLTPEEVFLSNIAVNSDVDIMVKILRRAGKIITYVQDDMLKISGEINNTVLEQELASKIRASVYCLGLFLATRGTAQVPLPGGDRIGDRPIDIHLECFQDLGVEHELKSGVVVAELTDSYEAVDDMIFLRYPSVGATCNLLILASRINRRIILKNVAKEPEIVDLANLLIKMGVSIAGAGSDSIIIKGQEYLHGGFSHEIIPDRIETGILITAAALNGGVCVIKGGIPTHNTALISTYRKSGVGITTDAEDNIIVNATAIEYKPINVIAMPYPGIATDLQPFITVYAQKCIGDSTVKDTVFPERFGYTSELNKLGANIIHLGNTIRITGVKNLNGGYVEGHDIRSATALVCAGLMAEGETIVSGLYHIKRGYYDLCSKFRELGADIKIE